MKARTLKELLSVLLIYIIGGMSHPGLCLAVSDLRYKSLITAVEYRILRDFIDNNRPKWYSKHYSFRSRNSDWYWATWDTEPRVKWLDSQIAKL